MMGVLRCEAKCIEVGWVKGLDIIHMCKYHIIYESTTSHVQLQQYSYCDRVKLRTHWDVLPSQMKDTWNVGIYVLVAKYSSRTWTARETQLLPLSWSFNQRWPVTHLEWSSCSVCCNSFYLLTNQKEHSIERCAGLLELLCGSRSKPEPCIQKLNNRNMTFEVQIRLSFSSRRAVCLMCAPAQTMQRKTQLEYIDIEENLSALGCLFSVHPLI